MVGLRAGQHAFFNALSQIRIAYPDSPLTEGHAGQRMPWVDGGQGGDNFAPLDGRAWRVQLHGTVRPDFAADLAALGLALDACPWTDAADAAGLRRDAAYLLRPDGHVALHDPHQDSRRLRDYATAHGLDFAIGA